MAPSSSPFIVGPTPGFSPQIGHLVAMMTYARRTTLEAAAGLTTKQLDHLHDPSSNSIGALLMHIAAVEVAYQRATFERRDLTDADRARWSAALDLGERARREIRERPLQHYLDALAETRSATLRELAERDDSWLEDTTPFWGGHPANNHFKWFHVFEDEINHRGQIRWLRKRLPRV
jgi:uncharacterized damage-inducible protein DinB